MASERRAYVKIPDAILREPWDDATLADMMRLQAFLNTRWARDRLPAEAAGRAFLGPQEMMLITRTTNVTRARARLLALPDRAGTGSLVSRLEIRGRIKGVYIDWPKFVQEQGYRDRDVPEVGGNLGAKDPSPQPQPQPQTQPQTQEEQDGADAPPAAAGSTARELALREWPRAQEAAAVYGKRWARKKPAAALLGQLVARSRELGLEVFCQGPHGYMAFHRVRRDGFDPMAHFVPETVFSAKNCAKYVDAFVEATEQGLSPPFEAVAAEPPKSFDQQREEDNAQWLAKLSGEDPAEPDRIAAGGARRGIPERSH